MHEFINIWAILGSMILSVVLGFAWYGPLFGKPWMELTGINMPEGQKPSMSMMTKPIILSLIGAGLMTFMLSSVMAFHNKFYSVSGVGSAMLLAFMLWLGFVTPGYLNFTGWEGKPWKLFFINSGYWLVFMILSAAIIAGLR
jgi:hypothetical protein